MRYFLDTEFNSYKGELISLSLLRVDMESLYMVFPRPKDINPWVRENVMPYLESVPKEVKINRVFRQDAQRLLAEFLKGDEDIEIIVDWPDDMQYFSELLMTGPGTMIDIPRMRFQLERIDGWPINGVSKHDLIFGANPTQHNAWWDSWALRFKYFEVNKIE